MKQRHNILKAGWLFLTAVLLVFVASCKSDDDAKVTGLSVTRDGTTIQDLHFNSSEMTTMLGVTTDGEWTAEIPAADTTWLHITPHAGPGWAYTDTAATNRNAYIKVSVESNREAQRTSQITLKAGNLSQIVTVTQDGTSTDPNDPFESAWDMVRNLKMGYNLGNTLDSNPEGDWWDPTGKTTKDYETAWKQPVTTQQIIDDIHAQGFNIIRVPVTWAPHMDANNNIDATWMARVKEVVDYCLKDGGYCIINVMHDTGTRSKEKQKLGGWLYADMASYPEQTVRYQAIWKQIAETFKDYDEHLIFESFNEILDEKSSWSAPAPGDDSYEAVNKLQQDFVNVVRATGGNNEYRNLAITTYSATGNENTTNHGDPLAELTLPKDVHSNHIYLSIHSYDPYNFCSNNSGKDANGKEYDYNKNIFDDECMTTIDGVVNRVSKRANALNIPFIFGEFGAIDEAKSMDERVKYATYVSTKLHGLHTTGLWWMGLYNRSKNEWYEQRIVDALKAGFGI